MAGDGRDLSGATASRALKPLPRSRVEQVMSETDAAHGAHRLVAKVRASAAVHAASWEALVPDRLAIDLSQERGERDAYCARARAKAVPRRHICDTHGLTIREFASLAMP